MRAGFIGVSTAVLAISISACGVERDLASAQLDVADGSGEILSGVARTPYSGIGEARITGDIGDVDALDAASDIQRVYDDGYLTIVDLFALSDDGRRVMLQLATASNEGVSLIQPGLGRLFRPWSARDGVGVGGLACVGADSGDDDAPLATTSYDARPCSIAIDAELGANDTVVVSVAAALPGAGEECRYVDDAPCAPDASTGRGCAAVDLEDLDGDGDGDLAADAGDARATFVLQR